MKKIKSGIIKVKVTQAMTYIQGLEDVTPAYGWQGNNMGIIIYSFNLNIPAKMSYGVLECDIVMLQNYMAMIL